MTDSLECCPKCGGKDFREIDCGPDSYDDDITYTSKICNNCELWHDGWNDNWYEGVTYWQQTQDATPYLKTKGE